jgi:hypothetical protein
MRNAFALLLALAVFNLIDLPSLTICTPPDCSTVGSVFQGPLTINPGQLLNAGEAVTLAGAGGRINPPGPVTEIVNGIAYKAFVSGSFQVMPAPFVAPPQNGQSQFAFSTPFTK